MLITLAQQGGGNAGGMIGLGIFLILYLAIIVIVLAGFWKMFTKAGQPGWAAIVPIYNAYIMCKIAGRPGWWVVLLLIPYINFIFWIIVMLDLAKSFGKSIGFAVGMILLSFIFIPILGFGDAEYQGPAAA
jgi:Family of unknown function (DUF5684)|tara:strand:+ start:366 stop:758 length:393 start_codon:yes stop_codon:yes gene_type:complete